MRAPIRVAFVSHHPHLRMGGQRSMVLLIEYLDRAVIEPLVICPAPGELSDHLAVLRCPVVYIPLYHIKPRTARAGWRSSRRIRALLRERAIDIIAPDAPRDALEATRRRFSTSQRVTARYRTIFDGADMERFRPADDWRTLIGVPIGGAMIMYLTRRRP